MRSLTSLRSSFFNQECDEANYHYIEYGGRSLEDFTLEDFRPMWRRAHTKALDWHRAANTIWNPETKQWEYHDHK